MRVRKSVRTLPKQKVLSAIYESVEQSFNDKSEGINPLETSRKLLKKDLEHEAVTDAAVYKSVSRTFNDLLTKGYLKITFGERFNENDPLYSPERRREILNGKDPLSFTSYILERNSIEIYSFKNTDQLYKQFFLDFDNEVKRVLSTQDEYIALYYGKTLREVCDLWFPSDNLQKKASLNERNNSYAIFISTLGDIFQPLMSMKDFQEMYSTNSNEIATLMNLKLYRGLTKDSKKPNCFLMNFPAIISTSSLDEIIKKNADILSRWKNTIINSDIYKKHTKIFERSKIRTFLLSLGPDPQKENSAFKKMYYSIVKNPEKIDFLNCYAEILGRYYPKHGDEYGDKCIGNDPDPKSLPSNIKDENFFKAVYYLNTGISIENLKSISRQYYMHKKNGNYKGLGVTVILTNDSHLKLNSLGYFISRKADEKRPPYFNRVYMLKEHMSDLEDIVYELTKDRKEDYYNWRENKEKEIGKGKK